MHYRADGKSYLSVGTGHVTSPSAAKASMGRCSQPKGWGGRMSIEAGVTSVREEAGPGQPFQLPDFYLPYPARLNPHLDGAASTSTSLNQPRPGRVAPDQ